MGELRDGADVWLDQARWLYAQETERLNGVRARATTLLGFSGGILAILAREVPSTSGPDASSRLFVWGVVAASVTIGMSALCFAYVLANVAVTRPSLTALLHEWNEWRDEAQRRDGSPKRKVFVSRDFANLLLRADLGDEFSPIATAGAAATSRARVLAFGSLLFGLAVIVVTASVVVGFVGELT
jgi:hypothetical protein